MKEMPAEHLLVEVEVNHPCWFVDLTEHDKDASLKCLQTLDIKGNDIVNVVELRASRIKDDLEFIRKHPLVRKLEILVQTPEYALMKTTSSYKNMTYKVLNESNLLLLDSPITKNGLDTELLLAKNFKDLSDVLQRLKEEGWDVHLRKKKYVPTADLPKLRTFRTSGFLDLTTAKETLTQKQIEVFQHACDMGYYDTPKKVTLEELAAYLDLSPSTTAEHLRKVENRLLPMLMKIMKTL